MQDKRILMIVNEFPPVGESGVQRPLKFLKYMVKDGWDVHVITPKRLPKNILDASLLDDIPRECKIHRTMSWGIKGATVSGLEQFRGEMLRDESSVKKFIWHLLKLVNDLLFPIDKQIGWVPFALLTALKQMRRYNISNVYITAFPFSAFMVGVLLKAMLGKRVFWVADYRDAWQFEPKFEEKTLPFRQRAIKRCDSMYLKRADYVIFPTAYIRDRYIAAYRFLKNKSTVITNGYDEDDFCGLHPHRFDKFCFLYMGKIYPHQGNPLPLLRVMRDVMKIDFSYVHIGTIGQAVLEQIGNESLDFYDYQGYKEHKVALEYAMGANVNVIVVNDDEASEGVYTGKLFELIRIGKPILALGPEKSVIENVLSETGLGCYAPLNSPSRIISALENMLAFQSVPNKHHEIIEKFSRANTCKQLQEIFFTQKYKDSRSE